MSIGDRVRRARKHAKLTQEKLGKAVGLKQATISDLEKGDSRSSAYLAQIAHACGVDPYWLATGNGAMESGTQDRGEANVCEAPQPIRHYRYPVISRVQAGAWTEAVTPYPPGAEPHQEATDYRAQGRAFWLEVQGDSMTAPPGSRPSIPEGTLVLFDTGVEAVPGKLVASLLADSNEATFKQLIEDGGRRYLRALNPAYPLIPINGNCRILGVAVEAKTRL